MANTELSETLQRPFTLSKYRAAWHKLGILEFTIETVASRIFQSFQRDEINFDTMSQCCQALEKIESLHAEELGLA